MEKIIITGISGFVGHHFLQYLYDIRKEIDVLGLDISMPLYNTDKYGDILQISIQKVDLLDVNSVERIIQEYKPDYLLHLASFSSVAYSWEHPTESFMNNTNIFLNVVNAVAKYVPTCRILSVGSSEEYGNVGKDDIPIKERQRLIPTSPYGVARVSQEMLSKLFVDSFGLDIILTRSFNHIGPWQDERFAIPSFVRKILDIKDRGLLKGTIVTGDISVIRDFIDVRDVVRAYWLLLQRGTKGEIYNICSGKGRSLETVIESIATHLDLQIECSIDAKLVRPNENPIIIGANYRIYDSVGWKPEIPFDKTIDDIINEMVVRNKRWGTLVE